MSSALLLLASLAVGQLSDAGYPPSSCYPSVPHEHIKIISVASCALDLDWNPGIPSYGTTPQGAGNYIANTSTLTPPQGQVDLYCDARLPAETTAFDYAELEYFASDEPGNVAPTLLAYLDAEGQNINGSYYYSQTVSLGACQGPLTPLYAGTNPLSLCSTSQGQQFALDGGAFPGFWPLQDWTLFSIHFLVVVPAAQALTQPNQVYRIIIHYEAP